MANRRAARFVTPSAVLMPSAAWAQADMPQAFLDSFLITAPTIVAAALAHWLIQRTSRRLLVLVARRRSGGGPIAAADTHPWARVIEGLFLVPKTLIWGSALWFISSHVVVVNTVRRTVAMALSMSLTSPLVTVNDRVYTVIDLLALPAALATVWVVVAAFSHLLRTRVLRATLADTGAQHIVALLVRYALLCIGTIVVLQIWGIDLRSLTILASVLGVGIGFGLQNIANNFVSGLILNFERPVQPGDFVNVGAWQGTVARIGGRSTEIRTLDNVTILIPNSRLLESEVVNWTHKDPLSRLHIPIGAAYGSDMRRVRAALLDAARSDPAVLHEPAPRVELRSFGDSAMELDLLVWTKDPRGQTRLKSDLNYRIEANFRRYGIEIPFPQRDLHLRSTQLDEMIQAVARQHLPAEEVAQLNGTNRYPDLAEIPAELEDGSTPHAWSDAEIDDLVRRMRAPGGVPIGNRRHLLATYPRCFVGRDAVDWLVRTANLSRDDAVQLGQYLIERHILHHVLDEHAFKDGNFYYRFYADETV